MRSPRRELIIWFALIVAGTAVRVAGSGRHPLWNDERKTLEYTITGPPQVLEYLSAENHLPLYFWIVAGWLRFRDGSLLSAGDETGIPDGEGRAFGPESARRRLRAILRFPSVLFGVLLIVVVYPLVRSLCPGRGQTALWTVFLVTFSPAHIYYSQEARMYTLLALLVLVSGASLYRATFGGGRRLWWILYSLSLASMIMTHYYGWIAWAFQSAWFLTVLARGRTHRPDRLCWYASQLLTGILLLWWIPLFADQMVADTYAWQEGMSFDRLAIVKTFAFYSAGYVSFFPTWYVAPALLLAFPLTLVPVALTLDKALRGRRSDQRLWGLLHGLNGYLTMHVLIPLLIPYIISLVFRPCYIIQRYTIFVWPLFVILVAQGWWRFPRKGRLLLAMAALFQVSVYLFCYHFLWHKDLLG